ncbi:hypothetical protein GCM10010261_24190 [Streptomyces pilosus]|nr:hypothetical protein GCM10010261_24190 [Streptomyces pilosus]
MALCGEAVEYTVPTSTSPSWVAVSGVTTAAPCTPSAVQVLQLPLVVLDDDLAAVAPRLRIVPLEDLDALLGLRVRSVKLSE